MLSCGIGRVSGRSFRRMILAVGLGCRSTLGSNHALAMENARLGRRRYRRMTPIDRCPLAGLGSCHTLIPGLRPGLCDVMLLGRGLLYCTGIHSLP